MTAPHPTHDYPITVFGEALRSLAGAGVAMMTTCILASAIPLTAAWTAFRRCRASAKQ